MAMNRALAFSVAAFPFALAAALYATGALQRIDAAIDSKLDRKRYRLEAPRPGPMRPLAEYAGWWQRDAMPPYGTEWVVNHPLTLITDDGQIVQPDPGGGGSWCAAFTEELQAAVEGVASGKEHPILSGQLARDALKICHSEAESIRTRKAVAI